MAFSQRQACLGKTACLETQSSWPGPGRASDSEAVAPLPPEEVARAEARCRALAELASLKQRVPVKVVDLAEAYDEERNEYRFHKGIDESGFPEEGEPLRYVREDKLDEKVAQPYEVLRDRVAVRKLPHTNARVLEVLELGQVVQVFEWDETWTWRKTHSKLRGGIGGLVEAWVMIRHDNLGRLLAPVGYQEDPQPTAPEEVSVSALGMAEEPAREEERGRRGGAGPEFEAVVQANAWLIRNHDELRYCISEMGVATAEPTDMVTTADGTQIMPAADILAVMGAGRAPYEVVRRPLVIARSAPTPSGKMLSAVNVGTIVDTYGMDASGLWVRVFGQFGSCPLFGPAWMLIEHTEFGTLLRAVH
uniref:Uncharacterized protein n=1 Tax=Alexandrium catenella TaxID=2925 RepID=A0A7S1RM72_ALECA